MGFCLQDSAIAKFSMKHPGKEGFIPPPKKIEFPRHNFQYRTCLLKTNLSFIIAIEMKGKDASAIKYVKRATWA